MLGFSRRKLSRRNLLSALGAAALAPAVARAERRVKPSEFFETVSLDFWLPGLDPAHDGLVIAQLSDLHIGGGVPDGRVIAAVRALNEAKPDLAMLTGDFVTMRWDPIERVPQLMSNITAPAYAVLGNHDHWTNPAKVKQGLEGVNIEVLQNENTTLRVRGADFTLIGIDDGHTRHDDTAAAFKGAATGSRLVLTHTPSVAKKLPAWEGLLCLSGHTHGGQLDVPRLTEGIFKRVGEPWYRGRYSVRGNQLYVNRGLGFGNGTKVPRVNSDPELSIITLHRAEPA